MVGFISSLYLVLFCLGGVIFSKYSYVAFIFFLLNKMRKTGTGETAQQVRALAALPGDQDSIPSTHVAAHNDL